MDFLSNLKKSDHHDETKPTDQPNKLPPAEHKPSNSELLNSAKVVADAAQAHFRNEPEKYDKNKLAGATADLLNAAAEYGKLDDNQGIGKYVDKAEDYLRQYGHSTSSSDSDKHKTTTATTTTAAHQTTEHGNKSEGESGGVGNYMKMAGDFLKK
ncbi:hypothetical protein ACJIZ3_025125 [Penstemon smallii]|uniref:Nodulin-related protein 1 n=1 Tax=Penstemon smallii TaxID=265156 RepID=A0ABD3TTQ1_9LAMI